MEDGSATWAELFGAYLRQNDLVIMEACRKVLKDFEEDLMACETWLEMFDALGKFYQPHMNREYFILIQSNQIGYLDEINDPQEFLKAYLQHYSK